MVEAKIINGRKYILIPADDGMEVNGKTTEKLKPHVGGAEVVEAKRRKQKRGCDAIMVALGCPAETASADAADRRKRRERGDV